MSQDKNELFVTALKLFKALSEYWFKMKVLDTGDNTVIKYVVQ
jgi:hypothetical protein